VNQDPLGLQGSKVRDDGTEEVWAKPLQGGAKAVILLNRGTASVRIKVRPTELGWPSGVVSVRDLWQKKELGGFSDGYFAEVPSHGVAMVRITRGAPAPIAEAKKKKN
jgi:alpha-galactosidase